jgi:hypothetical protein
MFLMAVVASACGSAPIRKGPVHPSSILPTTPELIAAGSPQTDGTMWLLVGSASVKTIQEISLTDGSVIHLVPVSNDATAIAESTGGTLAVGYGNPSGTVELRSGSSGGLTRTTTVGQPVKDIAVQGDTDIFFVLDGTATVTTVNALSAPGQPVLPAIGVELDSIALAVAPDGTDLYLLESSGTIDDVPVASSKTNLASSQFFGGVRARQLALSGDGTTLFVLKDVRGGANVGVFNVATEQQKKVLPAPAGSVDLVPSLDGRHLYLLIGTPTVGNIQVVPVG